MSAMFDIHPDMDEVIAAKQAVAQVTAAAGNEVVLRCARRMIHGFLRARFSGAEAAAEFARPCGFLRSRLAT